MSNHQDSLNREAPNRHLKGGKKYKEMIAQGEKKASSLPFQFIKPSKGTQARREIYYICGSCSRISNVNRNTISATCSGCRAYNRIDEVRSFSSSEELESYLQALEDND